MLSEAKHLRSIFVVRGSRIGSEIESLASRTSSTALQLRFAQNDTMRLLFPRCRFSVRRARLLFRRSNRCERNTFRERKLSASGLADNKRAQLFRLESVQSQCLRLQRSEHWRWRSAAGDNLKPMNKLPLRHRTD